MLPDRNTIPAPVLRRRPATNRQRIKAAVVSSHLYVRGMTAGQLFDAVQIRLASRALDSVQSWT